MFEHLKGTRLLSVTATAGRRRAHITTRQVVTAGAGTSLGAHASKTLTLRLNPKGRALLVHRARLASRLTVTTGSRTLESATVSVLRQVTVKAKTKKR